MINLIYLRIKDCAYRWSTGTSRSNKSRSTSLSLCSNTNEPWFNMLFDFVRIIMSDYGDTQKTLTLSPGAPAGPGGPIGPVIPRMPSLPGAPSVPLAPWSPWDKSLLSVLRICALQFNCQEQLSKFRVVHHKYSLCHP